MVDNKVENIFLGSNNNNNNNNDYVLKPKSLEDDESDLQRKYIIQNLSISFLI
jgi:hypothetical protein